MIKASELRIGNYVNIANIGVCKILSTSNLACDVECVDPSVPAYGGLTYATGLSSSYIPLSEDWLKKCGFQINNVGEYVLLIPWMPIAVVATLCGDGKSVATLKHFQKQISQPFMCVHQLQNLFFALTGEELKIQL